METENKKNVVWFKEVTKKDVEQVGGKNGSLGEMFSQLSEKGVSVPNGFITTADAYRYYLKFNGIDRKFEEIFKGLNVKTTETRERPSEEFDT